MELFALGFAAGLALAWFITDRVDKDLTDEIIRRVKDRQ